MVVLKHGVFENSTEEESCGQRHEKTQRETGTGIRQSLEKIKIITQSREMHCLRKTTSLLFYNQCLTAPWTAFSHAKFQSTLHVLWKRLTVKIRLKFALDHFCTNPATEWNSLKTAGESEDRDIITVTYYSWMFAYILFRTDYSLNQPEALSLCHLITLISLFSGPNCSASVLLNQADWKLPIILDKNL